jgi:uncharacterized membrane protein
MSSISNLMELVKKRILFIYLVQRVNGGSFCLYIFRDSRTQYENIGGSGISGGSSGSGGGGGGILFIYFS